MKRVALQLLDTGGGSIMHWACVVLQAVPQGTFTGRGKNGLT